MLCEKCGKTIPENSQFCNHCGSEVSRNIGLEECTGKPSVKSKSKVAVIIISCFAVLLVAVLGVFVLAPALKPEEPTTETQYQPNAEYLALFADAEMTELDDSVSTPNSMTYAKALENCISKITVGYETEIIKEMIISIYVPKFGNVLDGIADYYIKSAEEKAKDFEFCEVKVITKDDGYVIRTTVRKLDTIDDAKAFLEVFYPGDSSHYEDGIITVSELQEYLLSEEFIRR